MAKDQRQIDRDAELDRQKEVSDALEAHHRASIKDAEKRLAEGNAYVDKAEEDRLKSVQDALNASVKAHDKNAAEAAKAKRS